MEQESGGEFLKAGPMLYGTMTEFVRSLVAQTFAELGVDCRDALRETILIRDGNYCGRRFATEDGMAMWFVEEGQIKFYGADGSVIRVIDAQAAPAALRRAA
jgi:hypothetical protein